MSQFPRVRGTGRTVLGWFCLSAALLLCGVVMTVLSAWALALWTPLPAPVSNASALVIFAEHGIEGQSPHVRAQHGFGLSVKQTTWFTEFGADDSVTEGGARLEGGMTVRGSGASGGRQQVLIFRAGVRSWRHMQVREVRAGWPMPALRATARSRGTDTGPDGQPLPELGPLETGIPDAEQRLPARLRLHAARTLPLQPEWTGFIVNSVLFACVPLGFIVGHRWMRMRVRNRLGLCLSCAYPVQGMDICPECGLRVTPARPVREGRA